MSSTRAVQCSSSLFWLLQKSRSLGRQVESGFGGERGRDLGRDGLLIIAVDAASVFLMCAHASTSVIRTRYCKHRSPLLSSWRSGGKCEAGAQAQSNFASGERRRLQCVMTRPEMDVLLLSPTLLACLRAWLPECAGESGKLNSPALTFNSPARSCCSFPSTLHNLSFLEMENSVPVLRLAPVTHTHTHTRIDAGSADRRQAGNDRPVSFVLVSHSTMHHRLAPFVSD